MHAAYVYTTIFLEVSKKYGLRDWNSNDDILKFEVILQKFVLDVNVATTLAVVRWPTVD